MELKLCVNMDNAAFSEDPDELSRILHKLAEKAHVMGKGTAGRIMDSNGNAVGQWKVQ